MGLLHVVRREREFIETLLWLRRTATYQKDTEGSDEEEHDDRAGHEKGG
jgi:hypothetical protein